MAPALLIRLRPTTPWRIGPDSGSRDQAGSVLHSDTIYSAVTQALKQIGLLEEWLEATARPHAEPAVRFSSAFPFQRNHLFVPPPEGLLPPAPGSTGQPAVFPWSRVQFMPVSAIQTLLEGKALDEQEWILDSHSGCLLPAASRAATGPYRLLRRSFFAVDRGGQGQGLPWDANCVQFAPGSGLWLAVEFSNPQTYAIWARRIEAAFQLLADNGMGGLRSLGFGRFKAPEIQAGLLHELLLPDYQPPSGNRAWWLLSVFSPGNADNVQWDAGRYSVVTRGGRDAGGRPKLNSRVVKEGSVLVAPRPPLGCIQDVSTGKAGHPVFRAAFAVALPIHWRVTP